MGGLHMGVQERRLTFSALAITLLIGGMAFTVLGESSAKADSPASVAANSVATGDLNANSTGDGTAPATAAKPAVDRSGKRRIGKASFYADRFGGRKMADGNIFRLHDSNAASRTLPLGTTAKVTNLETGKSAVVTIQDRGPYVDGRIVDLSPGTAQSIGLSKRKGVTQVEVTPITVPLPNGGVKLGQAADDPIVALNERRDRGNVSQEQWDRWN
jgi:rare lipoprotein A (peptidoglycan hydrolase)